MGGGKFANNGLVAAPPGVPDDVMKQLVDSFDKALQNPDVVANINKKGMAVKRLTQAETDAVVKGMDSIVVEYLELVRAKSKSQ